MSICLEYFSQRLVFVISARNEDDNASTPACENENK